MYPRREAKQNVPRDFRNEKTKFFGETRYDMYLILSALMFRPYIYVFNLCTPDFSQVRFVPAVQVGTTNNLATSMSAVVIVYFRHSCYNNSLY